MLNFSKPLYYLQPNKTVCLTDSKRTNNHTQKLIDDSKGYFSASIRVQTFTNQVSYNEGAQRSVDQ